MKKVSIAVILLLIVTGSTYANDHHYEGPNPALKNVVPDFNGEEHFKATWPGATEIVFKVMGQFTKVNFTWKELKLEVFYDREGDLIATCRKIPVGNLPLPLQMSLQKEYAGFALTEATEFDDPNDGLTWYVSVSDAQKTYLLHISANGSIYVFKKMKN